MHRIVPFRRQRIPIFHKPNSRFRVGFEGRKQLKASMGSQFKSLVNFARKSTKKDFLEEFHKPAPDRSKQERIDYPGGMIRYSDIFPYKSKQCVHVTAEELMAKTGYTPEDFWREVKKPTTVMPSTELGFSIERPKPIDNIYDEV